MLRRFVFAFCIATIQQVVHADATVVKTRLLSDVLIEKKITAPATAVAINSSLISAEISARINKIHVQVGDTVKAGETLATLDCRSFKNVQLSTAAQKDSLVTRVQLAEQQLKRAKSLRKENNLSAEILDQRVADLDIARADLKSQAASIADAKLAVERCVISAPYRAAVTERLAGEGTLATPGLALLQIVGLDAAELSAQVPVNLTDSMVQSKSVTFVNGGTPQPVVIRSLSPVINAASGNREVRLRTKIDLTPGASGRLEWVSPKMLPASLLSRRDDQLGVFISDADTAKFVVIESALEGRPAVVDLPADTQIVIEGRHQLSDGDEIRNSND